MDETTELTGNLLTENFPDTLISTGRTVLITFTSDSYVTGSGFKIQYDAGKKRIKEQ